MTEFHKDDSVAEEVSAVGERVKGATKNAVGAVTGDRALEREGERENAEGRARQGANKVMEETDGVPGTSVGREPWNRDMIGTRARDAQHAAELERNFGSYGGTSVRR